mmetsp:Transcript_38749/g.95802  ORF Transcript_38749/g.95802 Transcript_38749/m.95802 type:complete len:203 (+) Transcript_38749:144-752(+)
MLKIHTNNATAASTAQRAALATRLAHGHSHRCRRCPARWRWRGARQHELSGRGLRSQRRGQWSRLDVRVDVDWDDSRHRNGESQWNRASSQWNRSLRRSDGGSVRHAERRGGAQPAGGVSGEVAGGVGEAGDDWHSIDRPCLCRHTFERADRDRGRPMLPGRLCRLRAQARQKLAQRRGGEAHQQFALVWGAGAARDRRRCH